MALRLRRGTDAQRALITPSEGELIYVTDTNEIYVGDGTTVGGIRITGEVVNQLDQLNDVDAALPQDGDILIYDSPTGDWVAGELPLVDLADVNALGITDGQILVWDATANAFVPGNNAFADTFDGDVTGSVFADDSSVIVDAVNRIVYADLVQANSLRTDVLLSSNIDAVTLELANSDAATETSLKVDSNDNFSSLDLVRASTGDISASAVQYGRITMGREDINGKVSTINIAGYQDGMIISHDTNGTHISPSKVMYVKDGTFAFGTYAPEAVRLHVQGNALVTGDLTASAFKGSVVADDSTILVDAVNGTIPGYIAIDVLKTIVAGAGTYGDFQTAIAAL